MPADQACWDLAIWSIQGLVGPGCLALNPPFWRLVVAVVKHKTTERDDYNSYPLLMVKCQQAILQEELLLRRTKEDTHPALCLGQSGTAATVRMHAFFYSTR